MSFSFPYALSAMAATALLALLKVTCVLLAALGATALMRRSSASARHLVWLVALIAALALPFLSMWSPVPVRVLPAAVRADVPNTAAATVQAPIARDNEAARASAPVVPATSPIARRPIGIGTLCLVLWSLGALLLLARLVIGALILRRVVRRGRVLEQPSWQRPLMEIADRLGLDDAPRLVESDRTKMPFATGFPKSVIVMPSESEAWSTERRCAVLIHELAHVKRRDLAGHMVSRIACAVYWFHPLVWTAARRLRAESERACDDLALVLGTRATEYAEHLLDIVKEVRDDRMPAVALAMAKPSEFEGRMLAILDPRRPRKAPGRVQAAWLVGTFAAMALVVGVLAPARRAAATTASPDRGAVATAPDLTDKKVEPKPVSDPKPAVERDKEKSDADAEPSDLASDAASREKSKADAAKEDANEVQRVEVLAKSLRTDPDAEVRRVAAWGLEQHADNAVAARALVDAVTKEQDEEAREMATWALANSHGAEVAAALEVAFRHDKSAKVRRTAAWAAGSIGSPSSVEGLATLLADPDADIREVAAWSIGSCSPDKAPAALVRALSDANRDVRQSVAWALYNIGDASAADELEAAFRREKDPEVQRDLIRALGSMGDEAVPTLTRLVDSPDREVRAVAIAALAGHNAGGPWPMPRPEPRPYP